MICTNMIAGTEPCKECGSRWLVVAETSDGEDRYFCFDSKDEAYAVRNHLDRSCCYLGMTFRKKSAIIFAPKG